MVNVEHRPSVLCSRSYSPGGCRDDRGSVPKKVPGMASLPVWPSSGNQILRIAVIGLGLTRRLSHSRGKIPLEGYGTIARRFYIFHSIWRARCGNWSYRMSRSLTGRIGRRSPRVRRRFTEQGGFFQFILSGSAGVQLVKCQKSMEAGAGNRGVYLLGLQIGSPEITAWRVGGVPHDGTPTKSERQGSNQAPYPNSDTVREYLVKQIHRTSHFLFEKPGLSGKLWDSLEIHLGETLLFWRLLREASDAYF
jgi:hypothetical protein